MFSPLTERRILGSLRARRASGDVPPPPVVLIVQDSLTGAFGTTLPAHIGEVGATWSSIVSGANTKLSGDQSAYHDGIGESWCSASGIPPTINYFMQAQFQMRSAMVGVQDGANIFVRHGARRASIFFNNLAAAWQLYGPDDLLKDSYGGDLVTTSFWPTVRLTAVGRVYTVTINGVQRIQWTDSADSATPGLAAARFFNLNTPSTNNSKLHLANILAQAA